MENSQQMLVIYGVTFLFAVCLFVFATWVLSTATRQYRDKFADDAQDNLRNMFVYIESKQLISLNIVAIIVVTLFSFLLFRSLLLTAICFVATLFLPKALFAFFKKRRLEAITGQLPDALLLICGTLRAGASLQTAIGQMAREIRPPISQEFLLMLREQRFGVSFDDALENLERRIPNEEFQLVCAAMKISRETGGNLAETLERLSETIRQKLTIEGKIRALTAQGKLQGIVVGLLPVLLILVLFQMEPAAMAPLLVTWYGWLTMAAIFVFLLVGGLIIRKIVNIDV
jgi:tight adherence protein B